MRLKRSAQEFDDWDTHTALDDVLAQLDEEFAPPSHDGPSPDLPFPRRYEEVMGRPMPQYQIDSVAPLLDDDGPRKLLLLAPPGHAKSSLMSFFAADTLGRNPNARIIYATHTRPFSILALDLVEAIMRSENFQAMYGNLIPPAGTETWQKAQRFVYRTDWRLRDPSLLALGAGSNTPGYRTDLIIGDDIVTFHNSMTPTMRGHLSNWYFGELDNRVDTGGRIIVIGARCYKPDLYGTLKDIYRTVEFKATPDKPLWPEVIPAELIEEKRATKYYLYLAQWEQTPVDLGSGFLGEADLHYYYELPDLFAFFMGVDPSQKVRSKAKVPRKPDLFSCSVLGTDRNKTAYLVDNLSIRASHDQQKEYIRDMYLRWKPQLIYFETDGGQIHFFEELAEEYPDMPLVDVTTEGISKPVRFATMASYVRRGRVLLPGVMMATGETVPKDIAQPIVKSWLGYPNEPDDPLDSLERAVRAAILQGVQAATGLVPVKQQKSPLSAPFRKPTELFDRGLVDYKPLFDRAVV